MGTASATMENLELTVPETSTKKVGSLYNIKNNKESVFAVINTFNQNEILALRIKKNEIRSLSSTAFLKKLLNTSGRLCILTHKECVPSAPELLPQTQKALIELFLQTGIKNYYQAFHSNPMPPDIVRYGGRYFDEKEIGSAVQAGLDFWLTNGPFEKKFCKNFSAYTGRSHVLTVNSGSSANLLAVSCLLSPKLKERRLKPGDEVITLAATFPTTLAPIVQNGLIPVFIDVDPKTGNADLDKMPLALSKKTKAVFLPHTLGLPFQADRVKAFCKKHRLWFIEDNCDALGTGYKNKLTGSYGHLSTYSFYPAHHITMGEGGAVTTDNPVLYRILLSLRDWGRDCWCPSGQDNTCKRRFSLKLGHLPKGYDHKYTYSHLGYNLKITEFQAAIGVEQLKKLPLFIKKRQSNWKAWEKLFSDYQEFFQIIQPLKNTNFSPFGFLFIIKSEAPFTRTELAKELENRGVQTRILFGGNILRQPAMTNQKISLRIENSKLLSSNRLNERDFRLLPGTETICHRALWIGVWPGILTEHRNHVGHALRSALKTLSTL